MDAYDGALNITLVTAERASALNFVDLLTFENGGV